MSCLKACISHSLTFYTVKTNRVPKNLVLNKLHASMVATAMNTNLLCQELFNCVLFIFIFHLCRSATPQFLVKIEVFWVYRILFAEIQLLKFKFHYEEVWQWSQELRIWKMKREWQVRIINMPAQFCLINVKHFYQKSKPLQCSTSVLLWSINCVLH
jgi:hypothetical protein